MTSRLIQGAMWALMLVLPLTALLALGSEGHPLTLLGGWGINLCAKLIARRKAPRPIVLTMRTLGAVACGLAVWLWLSLYWS